MKRGEDIYNEMRVDIKDSLGFPANYNYLSIQQKIFVDSLLENDIYSGCIEDTTEELKYVVTDILETIKKLESTKENNEKK